jgi:hypothetical protein
MERCQMAKDKQQKHEITEAKAASSKMSRKEFEEDLSSALDLA